LEDFVYKYQGRRVELRFFGGDIMQGRVGWFDEGGDELGFDFHDVDSDGKRLPHDMCIKKSEVEFFIPLEGENPPVRWSYPVEDIALHIGKMVEVSIRAGEKAGETFIGRVVRVDKNPGVRMQFTLKIGETDIIIKKGEASAYHLADDGWNAE
jgi:small nuclear ribonucleoprotein (snRNP)-like protein